MKLNQFPSLRPGAALAISLCVFSSVASAGQAVHGVPNFQTVNNEIYRGGQPTEQGFQTLASMGVKTVVDLRESGHRSKAEKKLVHSLGMHYVSIPMKGMTRPTDQQISRALRVMNNGSAAPVFVHCRRGKDRTGAVVAAYRIEHDQWSNQQAIQEARGYGMGWYQLQIQRYVQNYQPKEKSPAVSASAAVDSFKEEAVGIADKVRRRATDLVDRVRN